MTAITHLVAVYTAGQVFNLEGRELYLAYLFGVGPDLDHLLIIRFYFNKYGLRWVRHYHWRTLLQEPVSLLWVLPLSWFLGSTAPVIFFGIHLGLDYLVSYPKYPFSPFSTYSTRGFLTSGPDWLKESFVLGTCLNLLLVLTRR